MKKKKIRNENNFQQIKKKNLSGKKIDEKNLETNLSNQVKNQLKSTNQIKTNPIKKIKF